ncbi:DUF4202 domain-containing protein [Algoriphagus aestuariicola]|jgi:hypothetical protein|uniref:DUF4202 domain-containing protein n=1 Tax=Algoriphagus aestuariicola TaxID=1852016 RepID=A0ABS3BPN7_9BACT|nr:DUF4202 domain-containing protein [Algoriphagus aestuariicola]MBN7801257.1 DUF4202 domain-containing protein [Algoriphagus aestuariicola]
MTPYDLAIQLIDQINTEDPTKEPWKGKDFPKELLYSHRMSKKLVDFAPEASEQLRIAARAQHIARWKIQRSEYPMDRVGYLTWREELKKMHADLTGNILEKVGFDEAFISRVKFLIRKKQLKTDAETQTLEDVVCLVFLEYYLEDFVAKHEFEKIKDILRKTWGKMSEKAHKEALKLNFSSQSLAIIREALFESND